MAWEQEAAVEKGECMFRQAEAYCLMQYQDEETGEVEVIWNSRDGVTPFGMASRQGNQQTHINWPQDIRSLFFVPNVGDRVFVDLTMERAVELRTEYVEKHWDEEVFGSKMSDSFSSKEEAIKTLAESDVGDGHSPSCVVVTEEMQEEFRKQAHARWAQQKILVNTRPRNTVAGKRFA